MERVDTEAFLAAGPASATLQMRNLDILDSRQKLAVYARAGVLSAGHGTADCSSRTSRDNRATADRELRPAKGPPPSRRRRLQIARASSPELQRISDRAPQETARHRSGDGSSNETLWAYC